MQACIGPGREYRVLMPVSDSRPVDLLIAHPSLVRREISCLDITVVIPSMLPPLPAMLQFTYRVLQLNYLLMQLMNKLLQLFYTLLQFTYMMLHLKYSLLSRNLSM